MTTPIQSSAPDSLGAVHAAFGSASVTKFWRTRWPIWTRPTTVLKILMWSRSKSLSQAIDAKRDVDAARLDPKLLPVASQGVLRLGAGALTTALTDPTKCWR